MSYTHCFWAERISALFFEDAQYRRTLLEACTDPEKYVRNHRERMLQRGIYTPLPHLFWIALVNALKDHHRLIELDWDATTGSLLNGVQWLLDHNFPHAAKEWNNDTRLPDRFHTPGTAPWDLYPVLNAALKKYALTIMMLDIGADSTPLIIDTVDRAMRLKSELPVAEKDRLVLFNENDPTS